MNLGTSFPKFFRLSDPLSAAAFRGAAKNLGVYERMELAKWAKLQITEPLVIQHDMGKVLRDFIWCTFEPLVHNRVIELLTGSRVTGWTTYPVEVYDRESKKVDGYHGLAITGRCQSIFLSKEHSQLVYEEMPGGLFPRYKGLHITTESWDGSDFFTAADGRTAYIIVTDKIRELFVKAKVTNVDLLPVEEVIGDAPDEPRFPKTTIRGTA